MDPMKKCPYRKIDYLDRFQQGINEMVNDLASNQKYVVAGSREMMEVLDRYSPSKRT